ncbi:MAG: hypothetical protein VX519_11670 [Myxococcota bacterium]|nr:hypothetical protein [Myxococcota bacterium]
MLGGLGGWWILILVSCLGEGSNGSEPNVTAPEATQEAENSAVSALDPKKALALYTGCQERVEGVEQAEECVQDSDCKAYGCSGEVCGAVGESEGLTSCEVLPCYRVLDQCGCTEGRCRWSVRGVGVFTAPESESRD